MILSKDLYRHHGYIKGSLLAMRIVLVTILRSVLGLEKKLPLLWPREKTRYSERFRGLLFLTQKDDGTLKCNSCGLCEQVCPTHCLHIESTSLQKDQGLPPTAVSLDLLRCMFCGLCVEACPVDALRHSNEYDYSRFAAKNWKLTTEDLLIVKS